MKRTISTMLIWSFLVISSFKDANAQRTWCLSIEFSTSQFREGFFSTIQTRDGGYALAGLTRTFGAGSSDAFILKLDSLANIQWARTIGGNSDDEARSIIQTNDGGYISVGITRSFGASDYDIYIIKLDSLGNLKWTRTIGNTRLNDVYSVIQTTDGKYILSGTTLDASGFGGDYVVKFDDSGNIEWTSIISPGTGGKSIIQTNDGGYILGGATCIIGPYCALYLIKLDPLGNVQWAKALDNVNNGELANAIVQSNDGGYVLAGGVLPNSGGGGGLYDFYIVKTDSNGNFQWAKAIGGMDDEVAYSIQRTRDGGYVLGGSNWSFNYGYAYVVKLDSLGNLQWTRRLGGPGLFDNSYSQVIQTNDGGYFVIGNSSRSGISNLFIAKLDSNGNICPSCDFGSNNSVYNFTLSTITMNTTQKSGGIVDSGGIVGNATGTRTVFCSITPISISENNFDVAPSICYSSNKIKISFGKVYDNVSISVKDVSGREIMRSDVKNVDKTELEIKGKDGIYFVELRNKYKKVVFKVVKAK